MSVRNSAWLAPLHRSLCHQCVNVGDVKRFEWLEDFIKSSSFILLQTEKNLSYLMICPPVTFSSMSHRVRKIPLTPFSWLDASHIGYWYKISSCTHTHTQTKTVIWNICHENYILSRKKRSLVNLSTEKES